MDRILTVHGGGRHGHVVAVAAMANGWVVHYTDQKFDNCLHRCPDRRRPYIIAIGDNAARKTFDGSGMVTIVHPTAFVDTSACVAHGTFVGPMAVVHVAAKVGRGCIINTGAIVEHDCVVQAWSHISPGAQLMGNVEIGEGCWIGAGAVVKEGLTIAPWTVIGCGSVVIKDIVEAGTYVGNPARRIRGD